MAPISLILIIKDFSSGVLSCFFFLIFRTGFFKMSFYRTFCFCPWNLLFDSLLYISFGLYLLFLILWGTSLSFGWNRLPFVCFVFALHLYKILLVYSIFCCAFFVFVCSLFLWLYYNLLFIICQYIFLIFSNYFSFYFVFILKSLFYFHNCIYFILFSDNLSGISYTFHHSTAVSNTFLNNSCPSCHASPRNPDSSNRSASITAWYSRASSSVKPT